MPLYVITSLDPVDVVDSDDDFPDTCVYTSRAKAIAVAKENARLFKVDLYVCALEPIALFKGRI